MAADPGTSLWLTLSSQLSCAGASLRHGHEDQYPLYVCGHLREREREREGKRERERDGESKKERDRESQRERESEFVCPPLPPCSAHLITFCFTFFIKVCDLFEASAIMAEGGF